MKKGLMILAILGMVIFGSAVGVSADEQPVVSGGNDIIVPLGEKPIGGDK